MKSFGRNKRTVLIIGTACILVCGAAFWYHAVKYRVINKEITKTVSKKSDGLYQVKYESVNVNELAGSVVLTNIQVVPDTGRQLAMMKSGDTSAAKMMVSAFIPRLQVLHFKTARALLMRELVCEQIIIDDPKITFHLYPGAKPFKNDKEPQELLYRQILGELKLIQADNVEINNSTVLGVDEVNNASRFSANKANIKLENVRIDSTYYFDTTRTLFCKRIAVSAGSASLGQGPTAAAITALNFDTRTKEFHLGSFKYQVNKTTSSVFSLAENIRINGLEWNGPAEHSDLAITKADIGKLTIEQRKATTEEGSTKQSEKWLNGWIKSFTMDELVVRSVNYKAMNSEDAAATFINNSSLHVKKVRMDSRMMTDQPVWSSMNELELSNEKVEIMSNDKMYKFVVAGMKLNTKEKTFSIKSVKVQPQYSEAEFARRCGIQCDRFSMVAQNIVANEIDIDRLFSGSFFSKKVVCDRSSLSVYHDMHYPANTESQVGNYPHQLLMKLKLPIKINLFIANNLELHYRENNALSDSIGDVGFYNSKLQITNIKNVDIAPADFTVAKFSTRFIGELPMKGSFVFDMNNWKNGNYKASATIDKKFKADAFNKIIIPLGMAKIETGNIQYLSCNVSADNYSISGSFNGLYDDLKLTLLEKKNNRINKKTITSLAANLLIKNRNKPGAKMRVGKIKAERQENKTFFNFTWKSVLGGIRSLLGVKLK